MLGVAFMMIEVALIQRWVLFLGQPVIAMAVLLFSLLGGGGLGSLWSGRIDGKEILPWVGKISLFVAVLVLCYTFSLPVLFSRILGLGLALRILVTVLLLGPLGFLMGFPFPLGIRLLKEMGNERDIPWMWGLNGVGSVLGSGVTIASALTVGFTGALLISAGCYFMIYLIFRRT